MQLTYRGHGLQCDFTLMTIGDYRGGSVTPAPSAVREGPNAPVERSQSRQPSYQAVAQPKTTVMPPPSQPASRSFTKEPQSQKAPRPSPPPPQPSLDPESLFIPVDEDEDRLWGERNYDDDQDKLGWDASADEVSLTCFVVRCATNDTQTRGLAKSRELTGNNSKLEPYETSWPEDAFTRIAPTQRLSQVR